MKKIAKAALLAGLALAAVQGEAAPKRVSGSGMGGASPYATDAYPGFDGLDEIPAPKKKEKSWFISVKRDTPAAQYAFVDELEAEGDYSGACKACDALVREWPASMEAPQAQLRMVKLLAKHEKDYEEAFDQLEYLLNFYSRDCPYLELVEYQYKLVNLMVTEKKTFLGFTFLSNRLVRQHYESIVRRAPGASYVPEAMLKIAALREEDHQYEEAVKVYQTLVTRFPGRDEAKAALYREASARMWLCRRLAYNKLRCRDTAGFLRMTIRRHGDLEQIEELKKWLEEVTAHLEKEAFAEAKFYDSRQRTRHAAIAAWEKFLRDYPATPHGDEVRARIAALKAGAPTGGAGEDVKAEEEKSEEAGE